MKRSVSLLIVLTFLLGMLSGCAGIKLQPDEAEIKSICELSTLECRYHQVAESTKDPEKGVSHLLDQEAKCWIEYDSIVTMGIDATKLSMTIEGDTVTVNIPQAKVLRVDVDTDSYVNAEPVTSKNSWYNRNKINAEDVSDAIENAKKDLEKDAQSNNKTLQIAFDQAKQIIENYIKMIGTSTNTEYQIKWNIIDA